MGTRACSAPSSISTSPRTSCFVRGAKGLGPLRTWRPAFESLCGRRGTAIRPANRAASMADPRKRKGCPSNSEGTLDGPFGHSLLGTSDRVTNRTAFPLHQGGLRRRRGGGCGEPTCVHGGSTLQKVCPFLAECGRAHVDATGALQLTHRAVLALPSRVGGGPRDTANWPASPPTSRTEARVPPSPRGSHSGSPSFRALQRAPPRGQQEVATAPRVLLLEPSRPIP